MVQVLEPTTTTSDVVTTDSGGGTVIPAVGLVSVEVYSWLLAYST